MYGEDLIVGPQENKKRWSRRMELYHEGKTKQSSSVWVPNIKNSISQDMTQQDEGSYQDGGFLKSSSELLGQIFRSFTNPHSHKA